MKREDSDRLPKRMLGSSFMMIDKVSVESRSSVNQTGAA